MPNNILDELNPSQREAVCYNDGPHLVIAGAGSGKTRVLTYKVAYLLQQGIAPQNILVLTFTNKASREMKKRIVQMVGAKAMSLYMGTFHSVCARLLRLEADLLGLTPEFTIYDNNDSRSLLKQIIKEMALDVKKYDNKTILNHISAAKNALLTPDGYAANKDYMRRDDMEHIRAMPLIYAEYQHRLLQANAMDFDDILMDMNALLRDNQQVREKYQQQFTHILIDEYQDTNYSQYLLIKRLAFPQNHICVVGDDSQSIYAFRGAQIGNILSFQQEYEGKLFKLERNYRSTQTIVEAANKLIAHNKNQIKKTIYSEKEQGEAIRLLKFETDRDESRDITAEILMQNKRKNVPYSSFAILYRTNAQARPFENELRRFSIPYQIYGGNSFYQSREIKDAIAYFRLVVNSNDSEALRRIINVPARGIGDTTMKKISEEALRQDKSLYQIISQIETANLAINAGTVRKIRDFVNMIQGFKASLNTLNAYELAKQILTTSDLLNALLVKGSSDDKERYDNLLKLLTDLETFVADHSEEGTCFLPNFLEDVALLTDQDVNINNTEPKVTLMTIHAAKGLEFENVYIVGLEENLFPSAVCFTASEEEEERRLMYVAMTRAQKTLTLTWARQRFRNGMITPCERSRFLDDLDLPNAQPMAPQPIATKPAFRPIPSVSIVQDKVEEKRIPFASEWEKGSRVRHKTFGEGTVVDTYIELENKKIEINFDQVGKKTLLLMFAKLEHC